MADSEVKNSLETSEKILSEVKEWELKNLEKVLLPIAETFGKNKGYLLWPLRVALSGKKFSPSPFEIADILGKEKTLKRIEQAIKLLN
jgi:glutamyl-tRNA synthetase